MASDTPDYENVTDPDLWRLYIECADGTAQQVLQKRHEGTLKNKVSEWLSEFDKASEDVAVDGLVLQSWIAFECDRGKPKQRKKLLKLTKTGAVDSELLACLRDSLDGALMLAYYKGNEEAWEAIRSYYSPSSLKGQPEFEIDRRFSPKRCAEQALRLCRLDPSEANACVAQALENAKDTKHRENKWDPNHERACPVLVWLQTIVRNCVFNLNKDLTRGVPRPTRPDDTADRLGYTSVDPSQFDSRRGTRLGDNPVASAELNEAVAALECCLKSLPWVGQLIVYLRDVYGFLGPEVTRLCRDMIVSLLDQALKMRSDSSSAQMAEWLFSEVCEVCSDPVRQMLETKKRPQGYAVKICERIACVLRNAAYRGKIREAEVSDMREWRNPGEHAQKHSDVENKKRRYKVQLVACMNRKGFLLPKLEPLLDQIDPPEDDKDEAS